MVGLRSSLCPWRGDWSRICGEFAGVTATDRVAVAIAFVVAFSVAGGLPWHVDRKKTRRMAVQEVNQRK